jgi:hypothetical protein
MKNRLIFWTVTVLLLMALFWMLGGLKDGRAEEPLQLAGLSNTMKRVVSSVPVTGGAAAGGGTCADGNDGIIINDSSTQTSYSNDIYVASRVVFGTSTTVTSYDVHMMNVYPDNQTVWMALYTDSSSAPNSEVSNTRVTVADARNVPNNAVYSWVLPTPKSGLSGTYWLVYYHNEAMVNLYQGTYPDLDRAGELCVSATGAPASWDCSSWTQNIVVKQIMGCQP